jgi:Na+-transporting NADH:ubiquinone oxidoreductase subunit C
MDRNSNIYTFIYAIIMVVVVATVLSVIAMVLQPKQKINVEIEKKRNILSAVNIESDAKNAPELYDKYITNVFAINIAGEILDGIDAFEIELRNVLRKDKNEMQLPVFIAKLDDNSEKYIFPLYGKGLWGPLWGYLALNDDLNSVFGANFSHQAETPGLGAEIDTQEFQNQFKDKEIFNEVGEFVSITAVKGEVSNINHEVDAISGGTITCNGLSDMIEECMSLYLQYIESVRNK